jgi:hypothetical protein
VKYSLRQLSIGRATSACSLRWISHAWLHGIVHTLEGDLDNARYWMSARSASFRAPRRLTEEIGAARRALGGE